MAQDSEFVAYVIAQLEDAAASLGLATEVRHHFNAVSFSLLDKRVALIVNNTLFMHLEQQSASRWLPNAKPLQPAGVTIDSQFYPVPLAWLTDSTRLALCLSAAYTAPSQQATA